MTTDEKIKRLEVLKLYLTQVDDMCKPLYDAAIIESRDQFQIHVSSLTIDVSKALSRVASLLAILKSGDRGAKIQKMHDAVAEATAVINEFMALQIE
jgi:hypothetical protein